MTNNNNTPSQPQHTMPFEELVVISRKSGSDTIYGLDIKGGHVLSGMPEIATMGYLNEHGARHSAFICRAVNCHDPLFAVYDIAYQLLARHQNGIGLNERDWNNLSSQLRIADDALDRVALAKARGEDGVK